MCNLSPEQRLRLKWSRPWSDPRCSEALGEAHPYPFTHTAWGVFPNNKQQDLSWVLPETSGSRKTLGGALIPKEGQSNNSTVLCGHVALNWGSLFVFMRAKHALTDFTVSLFFRVYYFKHENTFKTTKQLPNETYEQEWLFSLTPFSPWKS